MKRLTKIITTFILVCLIAAISVTGTSAACTERVIYYGNLSDILGCGDNCGAACPSDTDCQTSLYDILRQAGSCDEAYQKILNDLGCSSCYICPQDNSCEEGDCAELPAVPSETAKAPAPAATQPEDSSPSSQAPTQAPTQATVETQPPSEKPSQAETQKPTEAKPAEVSALSEYEREVVRLINIIRAQNGLGQLQINEELSRVARIKSQDMHDLHYFSHTSPTYGSPFDMMTEFGIRYRTAGENIAMGYSTPQSVVDGWMNSDGHRKNILNPNFTQIGMGYVASGNYWTQMFIG